MRSDLNLMLAGFGGQGVMVAGQILCYTACETTDKFVTFFPSYGVEMRGGTANCYVVIGDEEIGAPMVNHVNNLMVFNTPSFEKFVDYLEPGGNLFINTSVVKERPTRTDINVVEVDAGTIAIELGSSKCLNLVMAGAFVGYTGVLPEESCYTEESHWDCLLEYPQYSRPEEWHGRKVPAVLLSGHHGNVADWRKKESYKRTMERRPDMFAKFDERKLTTKHDRKVLAEAKAEFAAEQAAKLAESAE